MEEEQRNSGESEAKHKAQETPVTPPNLLNRQPLSSDHSHRYKRIHFSWVFPWQREERGIGQRETEGWKRRGKKDGGLALKQVSDRHHRGAIVLYLPRPFLMRAPEGGGAGRHRNRKGGGLRYAGSKWGMTINPPPH